MGITALNSEGSEISTWNLLGVVPVKWNGPTLDIMSNALATETLEIAYEQILGLGSVVEAGHRRRDDRVGVRVLLRPVRW